MTKSPVALIRPDLISFNLKVREAIFGELYDSCASHESAMVFVTKVSRARSLSGHSIRRIRTRLMEGGTEVRWYFIRLGSGRTMSSNT
jgi:hypothetical protein